MHTRKTYFVFFISLFIFSFSFSQTEPSPVQEKDSLLNKKNFFKINLTGIPLKNYSFCFERAVSRKISVSVSFRTMPSGSIPFQKLILKKIDANDLETRETIETLRLSNFAFTPELKLYLSKRGYGRGFYISFFYRYAQFRASPLLFEVEDSPVSSRKINFSGKFSANTGGLLFGVQWPIGKSLCLDLWLLGPHYGAGNGLFSSSPSPALTSNEQVDLRTKLEDLDIPLTNKTISVSANSASLKLDGPWGGIRSGINLGFRF